MVSQVVASVPQSVSKQSSEDKDKERTLAQKDEEEEGSEDEEDRDQGSNEVELSPPLQKDSTIVEATQKRAEIVRRGAAILSQAALNPPVKPIELARLLVANPLSGDTYAVLEDGALARSYRGFEPPETDSDWGTLHDSSDAAARSDLLRFCRQSLDLVNASVEDRLVTRHGFLMRKPSGFRWLFKLISKVEALLYQREYEMYSRGPSSKDWRNALIARQYYEWLRNQPDWAHLAPMDGEARIKDFEFEEATKAFIRIRVHGGRSRARLTVLYLQLGPAVLLDPTWDSNNMHFHRSRTFPGVLGYLSDYPDLPVDDTAETLVALGRYVGGPVVAEYISKFLAAYPSRPAQADHTTGATDIL
ncbi:hypothetical protein DENSPDRAFT_495622 [Dentipellis sp. KUC8613]|nr:hypothetical protein DENSPDRAFT_495622 [Dentipellis sp. KUC8613]